MYPNATTNQVNPRCFAALAVVLLASMNARTLVAAAPRKSLSHADAAARIRTLFSASVFTKSPVGVWVESLDRNQILYQRNENRPFIPASNLKIFTTAAGLSLLGPDFRYRTHLYRTGEIDGGILRGHLVIRGSGDPTISGRFDNGNVTATFEAWAEAMKRMGITAVEGDVIGDDDAFTDQTIPEGWSTGYLVHWFAAGSSALSLNDNCVDVTVRPGPSVGSRARISLKPPTAYVTVDNQVKTVPTRNRRPEVGFRRQAGSNRITAVGKIPPNSKEYRSWATIHEPTLFTATVFKETLERSGVRVTGRARDIDEVPDKEKLRRRLNPLAARESPSLRDILPVVNKSSHNFYADQLFLTIGERTFGVGDWVHSASGVVSFLTSINVDPTGLRMVDGCGLARLNTVTPAQIAAVLRHMWRHPHSQVFRDSLSVMGEDGTLRRRLQGTPAEERVVAKTGYIGGVRALSGYVRTLAGEDIVFCFLLNNAEPASAAFREHVDEALLTLVNMR